MVAAMRLHGTEEEENSDDSILQLSDIRVVQHLSPACRAARKRGLADLFASKVQCLHDRQISAVKKWKAGEKGGGSLAPTKNI